VTESGGSTVVEAAVDERELIDMEAAFRSLNGFEQREVEDHFRVRVVKLADDEFMLMRALLFVVNKRAGMVPVDAFRNAMLLPLEEVTDRFIQPDAAAVDVDPGLREQQDREYAEFVVAVGMSWMPEQYRALTIGERVALLEAAAAAQKARGY